MRLIDADALPEHKFPENQCNRFGDGAYYRQGWNDAIDAIVDNEDAVDAVPVVRCGDCIRYRPDGNVWGRCTVAVNRMRKKDFCSYGVRKDGDGNG